jgi:transposase
MKNKPRVYTEEYKTQALQLAEDLGSMAAAAKQLGITDVNLHNWKNKRLAAQGGSIKKPEEGDELKRLRRENAEQKKVIEILKSAAAFFSQDHLK